MKKKEIRKLFEPSKAKILIWILYCAVPFLLHAIDSYYKQNYLKTWPPYQYFLIPWLPMHILLSILPQEFIWEVYTPKRISLFVYYLISPFYLYFLASLTIFIIKKAVNLFRLLQSRNREVASVFLVVGTVSIIVIPAFLHLTRPEPEVTDYLSCVQAKYPVNKNVSPMQCTTPDGRTFTEYVAHSTEYTNIQTPVLERAYSGSTGEKYRIEGYSAKRIEVGEEFIIDPEKLLLPPSYTDIAEGYVGAIQLKLVNVGNKQITIRILADEWPNQEFVPREKQEEKVIKHGTCIAGNPLVMDVSYNYCFEHGGLNIYRIKLKAESTLPKP